MPQLNTEFWVSQIFWLTIIFGSLYILLSKLVLPKISNNLEARKSQIAENIEKAEEQRKESDQKLKDYEKIINDAKIEAKNIFNQTREKILRDINNKKESLEKEIYEEILNNEIKNGMPEGVILSGQKTFDERLQKINWQTYYKSWPFNESALALYEWAPIADELKTLDRKIVLNSMILKWDNIKEEFEKLISI